MCAQPCTGGISENEAHSRRRWLSPQSAHSSSQVAPPTRGDNGDDSGLVEGSSITAAWNQPFYSYNGNTSFGNATANNNIIYLTLDGFNYYNNAPELVQNTSFGTYELVTKTR